jgi:hypothetical protein
MSPHHPVSLDFDVAIALRGIDVEAKQADAIREKYKQKSGDTGEFDADDIGRQVNF